MDPLTHLILTRTLVATERPHQPAILLAGVAPDLTWYLVYPAWVIAKGQPRAALASGDWPEPPAWLVVAHHATHSIPLALIAAGFIRLATGRWPRRVLAAWLLHIVVDIPTHSRRQWGPRFLWPLSTFSVDGISWVEIVRRSWGGR